MFSIRGRLRMHACRSGFQNCPELLASSVFSNNASTCISPTNEKNFGFHSSRLYERVVSHLLTHPPDTYPENV